MPDRETPDGASEGPPQEPLAGSNGQGGSNQNPPPNEDGGSAADDQDRTERLEGDIRTGERWLVGFAAAGVIVNVLIFCVYFGQLTQMTEATKAATKSANTAADSFEISNGNFDRTMAQMLSQVAVERAQIRVDQRAWLWVNIPVAPQWEIGKNITITIKILDSGRPPPSMCMEALKSNCCLRISHQILSTRSGTKAATLMWGLSSQTHRIR